MKISGLKKINIKIIKNKKGDLIKYLCSKDSFFNKFGEIYFSEIKKGQIKGWKLHKRYKCHLAVISGSVTFNFVDSRKNSKTYLKKDKITLSKKNHGILIIPPNIWFSFTTKNKISLVVNTLNHPHSDLETENKPISESFEN
tara:strand:+ start:1101 stop:1526 length:426 start_codon:yes stop_codon:yes gene_type:complete